MKNFHPDTWCLKCSAFWKYFLVLLVLLTSFVYSLPNLYQSSPAIEINLNDSTQVQDIIEKLNQPEDKVIYKDKINNNTIRLPDSDNTRKIYFNLNKWKKEKRIR